VKSISTKFYSLFISLIILPISVMGITFLMIYKTQIEKRIHFEQGEILESLRINVINKHITDTESLLISLSKDPKLPYIYNNPKYKEEVLSDWELCQTLFPERCWIYYGSNHNQICVSPEWTPPKGYNLLKRPWFITGKESNTIKWTSPYTEYITGDIVISATLGIKDTNNNYTGVLSIDTTAMDFLKLMQNYSSDKNTRLLVISDEGFAVSLNQGGSELIIENKSYNWKSIIGTNNNLIEIDNRNYYYKISEISKLKLCLVSLYNAEDVIKEITPVFTIIFLIFMFSLACSIVAGYYLSKNTIGKIVLINNYIGRIVQGEYRIEYVIQSEDEFRSVNTNLNILTKTIQSQIKELAKLNTELNNELVENKKLVDLRTSLLHLISHNSSPSIMLQLELCKELLENDRNNQSLIMIHNASRNIRTLNENIMTYLKLDEGFAGDYKDEIDLMETTELIINNSIIQFTAKNITFKVISDIKSKIYSNYFLIKVTLENLIENAVKYSFNNSIVLINITEDENTIRWTITDGGPGFSEQDRKQLYGKFQKLSAKPTGGESSTGLGLYLVRMIAECLKVKITLLDESNLSNNTQSDNSKGACFQLIFTKNDLNGGFHN